MTPERENDVFQLRLVLVATLFFVVYPAVGDESGKTKPLSAAVQEFNQQALTDRAGKDQPPLTEDEVVAAIRGWNRKQIPAIDEIYQIYQTIADTKQLPADATLSYTTEWSGFNEFDFEVWWVDLNIQRGQGIGYAFRIRDQKLRSWPTGQPRPARPFVTVSPRFRKDKAEIDKLLAEFRQLYHLDQGQVIKRINAPQPSGRLYDLDKWIPEFHVLSDGTYKEANLRCLIYQERGGKLEDKVPFFAYSSAPSTGYEAGTVASIISNVEYRDIEDPDHLLLDKSIVGDYVVNADAPTEKVVAAFGQILKNECGLPVKLELREVEHATVTVRGKLKPPFELKPDSPLELYAATLQPGKGEKDQGTFQEFLEDLGRFIEPSGRVVSEVENPPRAKISWHRNIRTRFDDKTLHEDREARSVLNHLEEQTGLTFTRELRKLRKIVVTRSE